MKKLAWTLLLLIAGTISLAQYQVKFILQEKTCLKHDGIFTTGTFSNWDSTANPKYLLKPAGGNQWSIILRLQPGPASYKFTRGTWNTVEKHISGSEVNDRSIVLAKDTILVDSVLAWRDELMQDKWCRLASEKTDTGKIPILAGLATNYAFYPEHYHSDSALHYAQAALALQQAIMQSPAYKSWIKQGPAPQLIRLQELLAIMLHSLGNYSKSLALRFENLKLAETQADPFLKIEAMRSIAEDYLVMKDYENVLRYGRQMDAGLARLSKKQARYAEIFHIEQWWAYNLMATAYYHLDSLSAALSVASKMALLARDSNDAYAGTLSDLLVADIYAKSGEENTALAYYRSAIPKAGRMSAYQMIAKAHLGMARVFQHTGLLDSALFYARQSMTFFQENQESVQAWGENSDTYIADLSPLLAALYKETNQVDSAYKYLQLANTVKDRLYNENKIRQFQVLGFNDENRRKELENEKRAAQEDLKTNIKLVVLVASVVSIGIVAFVLYRGNRQKQEANKILQSTLSDLQATQTQLIQSEKMASLGELTAGIAHEIQNPLNFVNNFSEINEELIAELQAEQKKDQRDLQAEDALLNDIRENARKINLHGKRAAAIVKGMLQHSRTSAGVKEPTDINKLADEYLRLAYHGLRAKDNSFNVILKTDYDDQLGKINVIPQDIGRVLLNLITNSFYAVNEKLKNSPQPQPGSEGYEPTVTVRTKAVKPPSGSLRASAFISISDNGKGIPEKILSKIFQPFFTTKPTGKGTGLGLSLSYDIVKAHGGELTVETKEGAGTTFTILLHH